MAPRTVEAPCLVDLQLPVHSLIQASSSPAPGTTSLGTISMSTIACVYICNRDGIILCIFYYYGVCIADTAVCNVLYKLQSACVIYSCFSVLIHTKFAVNRTPFTGNQQFRMDYLGAQFSRNAEIRHLQADEWGGYFNFNAAWTVCGGA